MLRERYKPASLSWLAVTSCCGYAGASWLKRVHFLKFSALIALDLALNLLLIPRYGALRLRLPLLLLLQRQGHVL